MSVKCTYCGTENKEYMNYCKSCGSLLPQRVAPSEVDINTKASANKNLERRNGDIFCPRCGIVVEEDAVFCKYCGFHLKEMNIIDSQFEEKTEVTPDLRDFKDIYEDSKQNKEKIQEKKKQPRLVTLLKDGETGQIFVLLEGVTDIGREEGNILIPDDPYISPRHARIIKRNDRYYLQDLNSLNGIYYQIKNPVNLSSGDYIFIGTQLLRFEILDEVERGLGPIKQHGTYLFGTPVKRWVARLLQITTEGIPRNIYYLYGKETVIGREIGHIVFPDDPYVSKKHARIIHDVNSHKFILEDLDSSNGTSIRFRGEREITHGDIFRIGHHLFRFEIV